MLGAAILGILAGFLARALLPGRQEMGFFATLLLGLAGALVGFFFFTEVLGIGDTEIFDLGGLVGAVIGSMVLLLIYDRFVLSRSEKPASARATSQAGQSQVGKGSGGEISSGRPNRERSGQRSERPKRDRPAE
jgi:uncharacterized membrane protein YeaQ/YmgE (transglycosylase-associated protein family)